jgi:hypothetical protein
VPRRGERGLHDLVGNAARSQRFEPGRPESARHFAQAVPANARGAATWADAEWYTFWAPDARYLNLLDPVFMAVPRPGAYRASPSVFEGTSPTCRWWSGPPSRASTSRPTNVTADRVAAWPLYPRFEGRWLDGRLVVGSIGGESAVLGRGVVTEVGLDAGAHVVAVESCGSEGAGGFYLVERLRDPRPAS